MLYPVETIYISDFTPNTSSAHPDLFEATLVNGAARSQTIILTVTVTRIQPSPEEVFRGNTNPFTLSESVRRITNRDLFGKGSDVQIKDYSIAQGQAESVGNQLLHTGRLPAGTYLIRVDVTTAQNVALGHDELRLQIGNPTRVELLSPGRRLGEAPPEVQTAGLRFLWTTDGTAPGAQYRLKVVRADNAASEEEAMNSHPSWETTTPATSEIYPGSAAALRLEPGGTYAWQVTREVSTSGGVERVQSPVYWFRIGGNTGNVQTMGGSGVDDAVARRLEDLLRRLGLGPELAGFHPLSVRLADGRIMTFDTLEQVLAAIAAGQLSLISIHIR
jgi:hypothetical protein